MRGTRFPHGVGGGSDIGSGLTFFKTTTFTNAQIKAIPTTPLTLVAAPGVGRMINPIRIVAVLNNTAGAYGNVGTADVDPASWKIVYGEDTGAEASSLCLMRVLLASTTEAVVQFAIPETLLDIDVALTDPATRGHETLVKIENMPLSLVDWMRDSGTDYTLGHASNSLIVHTLYMVLNV